MDIKLQDNQFVSLKVEGLREGVKSALKQGDSLSLISSDTTVATVDLGADGVTAIVKAVGVDGAALITASVGGFTDSLNVTVAVRPLEGIVIEAGYPQNVVA